MVLLEQVWGAGWFCPPGRGKKRTPSSWLRSVELCHTKLGIILGLSQLHPKHLLEVTSQSMALLWSCQLRDPDLLPPLNSCESNDRVALPLPHIHQDIFSSPERQISLSCLRGPLLAEVCPTKVCLLNWLLQTGMPEVPHLLMSLWTDTSKQVLSLLVHSWHRIRSCSTWGPHSSLRNALLSKLC